MNSLDELLRNASTRLDHATSAVGAPPFVPVTHHGGRIAAGVVCVAAVAATGFVIATHRDATPPVAYPPGLLEGRFGTEIVMREVPDGDDDPLTFSLQADPDAGEVSVRRTSEGATDATVAATQGTLPADPIAPVSSAGTDEVPSSDGVVIAASADQGADDPATLCLDSSGAGGLCGSDDLFVRTSLQVGQRGPLAQVLVLGVPADTFAVTMSAGSDVHWARPVRDVVAFPFPESASADVTVNAIDEKGRVIWTESQSDISMTHAEIAAAAVTSQTAATIPGGWFGDIGDSIDIGTTYMRQHGRTALTGFTGPFALQGYAAGPTPEENASWVWAVTVRTSDVDAVTARVNTLGTGSIRRTLSPSADVRVLVWGGDDVALAEVDRFTDSIVRTDPLPTGNIDLDPAWSFNGSGGSWSPGQDGSVLSALLTDVVGQVDGVDLVAFADDTGAVQFHVTDAYGNWAQVGGQKNTYVTPAAGEWLFAGLTAVPADIAAITLTMLDGSTVTPEIIDVRPLVDAKLMHMPDSFQQDQIVSVDITPG